MLIIIKQTLNKHSIFTDSLRIQEASTSPQTFLSVSIVFFIKRSFFKSVSIHKVSHLLITKITLFGLNPIISFCRCFTWASIRPILNNSNKIIKRILKVYHKYSHMFIIFFFSKVAWLKLHSWCFYFMKNQGWYDLHRYTFDSLAYLYFFISITFCDSCVFLADNNAMSISLQYFYLTYA